MGAAKDAKWLERNVGKMSEQPFPGSIGSVRDKMELKLFRSAVGYTMRCTYVLELSSLTDSVRGGNFLIAVQVAKSSLPNYYHLVFSLQQL